MAKEQSSNSHTQHKNDKALLIIDMLNTLDFPQGPDLLEHALPAAKAIKSLKAEYKKQKIPVIYVNDNFGLWRSERSVVYENCAHPDSLGCELAKLLKPEDDDYFVLKPKHSGFYSTTLDVLLRELGTHSLTMTGIAGNICVLFTVNDAYMRDFDIWVPENCIASNTQEDNDYAIGQMRDVFGVNTESTDFDS